ATLADEIATLTDETATLTDELDTLTNETATPFNKIGEPSGELRDLTEEKCLFPGCNARALGLKEVIFLFSF
ncbi:MAG: hypothetical protein ACQER7_08150, partial [Bacteroidota bacterium]